MVPFIAQVNAAASANDAPSNLLVALITAFIGAMIGALLTQYFYNKAEKQKEWEVIAALDAELKENLALIAKRQEMIHQLRERFSLNNYNPITVFAFPRAIYSSYLPAIYGRLSPEKTRNLYLIYTYLGIVDEVLLNLGELVTISKGQRNYQMPLHGAVIKMGDMKLVLQKAEDLINNYLVGRPAQFPHNDSYLGVI